MVLLLGRHLQKIAKETRFVAYSTEQIQAYMLLATTSSTLIVLSIVYTSVTYISNKEALHAEEEKSESSKMTIKDGWING